MTWKAWGSALLGSSFITVPVLACPGVVPCVPSACLSMHTHAASTAAGGYSYQGINFPSSKMTLLAHLELSQIGGNPGSTGSSIYGWVDPLTNREYAIMGRSNGTSIVDITNPRQPVYVANVPKFGPSAETLWRDPRVYGNYAFIAVDGTNHPLQVVDLKKVRLYSGTPITIQPSFNYRGENNDIFGIHTLDINKETGFLYAAGASPNSGRLHVIDVRNPTRPQQAGYHTTEGYTHETEVVVYRGPDKQYHGREIAFNSNGPENLLSIVDVTNKGQLQTISNRTYAGAGFVHQGWLTEDQRYFFQNDEFDEFFGAPRTRTHLWDVSDLNSPVYRGFYQHTTSSIDHNLYVKDGYVFESNYTTGLRVMKIGNLESSNPNDWLTEAAFFDTFPFGDFQSFNGAWSNYPYFPSGNIVVSDIDGGLFILRPDLPEWNIVIGDSIDPKFPGSTVFATVPEPSARIMALVALTLIAARRPCQSDWIAASF